jgi:hypothetical protein
MDLIRYVKMWIINHLTTTKDEGCKVHTNKACTIQEQHTKE